MSAAVKQKPKMYGGLRPRFLVQRRIKKNGGQWDETKYVNEGSDWTTCSFIHEGVEREFIYSSWNGKFLVRQPDGSIITEEDGEMDGVPWYDFLLDLIYEPAVSA